MNWIIAQGGLPGEQLANNVLNADLVNVLALIIFLLALVIVVVALAALVMMYYSNKGISTLAATGQNMSNANAQWAATDAKKTEALHESAQATQALVGEVAMFREDFTRTQIINQQTLSEHTVAIRAHEDKADGRVKTINDHTTHIGEDITNLFGEAVITINSATTEAVAPALAALVEIKEFFTALNGLQKEQMETLKQQQQEQMSILQEQQTAQLDYLTEQQDGWTRIVQNLVVRAEKTIIESIHTETKPDEKPVEIPSVLDRPDAGTPEPALVADGGLGSGSS